MSLGMIREAAMSVVKCNYVSPWCFHQFASASYEIHF